MPKRTKFHERNDAIQERFRHLTKTKHMQSAFAIETIASEFWLQESTVSNIVYRQGRYKVPDKPKSGEQITLF